MTTPTPAPAPQPAPAADYPGKTLGIVALVLSILGIFSYGTLSLVGLILGVVAGNQSKAAGVENKLARYGVIVGIIGLVIGVIAGIVITIITVATMNAGLSYVG
jgi:hypothetical protein